MYKVGLKTVSPIIDSQMRQIAFQKHIAHLSTIKSDIDRSQPPPVGRLISYQKRMEQKRYTEKMLEQENLQMIRESKKRSKSTLSKKNTFDDNGWVNELEKVSDAKCIQPRSRTCPKNSNQNSIPNRAKLFDNKQSKYSDYYGISKQDEEKKSVKHYPRKSVSAMQTLNSKKNRISSRQTQQQEPEISYQNEQEEQNESFQENNSYVQYDIDQINDEEQINQINEQQTNQYKKNSNMVLYETFPDAPPPSAEVFPTESKNFRQVIGSDIKSLSQPVYYSKPLLVHTVEEEEEENEVQSQIRQMLFHKFAKF